MDLSMVFKFDIKINKSRDNQDGIMGKLDNVIRKSMDTNNNNYLFERQYENGFGLLQNPKLFPYL